MSVSVSNYMCNFITINSILMVEQNCVYLVIMISSMITKKPSCMQFMQCDRDSGHSADLLQCDATHCRR